MPEKSLGTIVLLSAVPWDGVFARPQQLALGFAARGNRVLFVEPSASYLAPLRRKEARKFPFGSLPRLVDDRLAVVTPPLGWPGGYRWRTLNIRNQRQLELYLRRSLASLHWEPTALLTHLPQTADLRVPWPVIYDCVDDHAAFADLSVLWRREVVLAMEIDLLRSAHGVCATSDALLRHCQQTRPDARLIGNGVDLEHFARAANGRTGYSGQPAPLVGFYGGLGAWVDVALVCEAARLAPDLNFMLIGPKEPSQNWPSLPRNLVYLGFIPYKELPGFLADFDVAMIPFKNTPLAHSVNPIKLYEYFASGKPVLVTDIPELTRWGDLVYPFTNAEQLVQAARDALGEAPSLPARRLDVARAHTWSAKVDQLSDLWPGRKHE